MKVLVLGATGMIGSEVVEELQRRGHVVTRGRRPGDHRPARPGTVVEVDPRDQDSVASAASGVDAVVSALGGGRYGDPGLVADAAPCLLAGLERVGVGRLLVVGGAGSLIDADGSRRVDAEDFPAQWRAGSLAQIAALAIYVRYGGPVSWTYLSPSDRIGAGARGSAWQLGADLLLRGPRGESWVSLADYAAALVDELEHPHFERRRFTVRSLHPENLLPLVTPAARVGLAPTEWSEIAGRSPGIYEPWGPGEYRKALLDQWSSADQVD